MHFLKAVHGTVILRRTENGNTQHTTLQLSTSLRNLLDGPEVTVSGMLRSFHPTNTRYWLTNIWMRRTHPSKCFLYERHKLQECPKAILCY